MLAQNNRVPKFEVGDLVRFHYDCTSKVGIVTKVKCYGVPRWYQYKITGVGWVYVEDNLTLLSSVKRDNQ